MSTTLRNTLPRGARTGKSLRASTLPGAGDGNRTRVTSLEGWGSAAELRPRSPDATWRGPRLSRAECDQAARAGQPARPLIEQPMYPRPCAAEPDSASLPDALTGGAGGMSMAAATVGAVELDPVLSGRFGGRWVGADSIMATTTVAETGAPDHGPPDAESLGRRAFERALSDSGLERRDVDGLSASFTYGGADPAVRGVSRPHSPPRHARWWDDAISRPRWRRSLPGRCDTIAVVHSLPSRAIGRQ